MNPDLILFLVVGVLCHSLFLYSFFDVYFQTPYYDTSKRFIVDYPQQAKRLVIFIGDGVRADSFFQDGSNDSPGSWLDKPSENLQLDPRTIPDKYKIRSREKYRAPFLIQKGTETGVWGVSHAAVPTETRPGHVAILGGKLEDLTAVTTGWQDNVIPFESVLSLSTKTWAFGAQSIIVGFQLLSPDTIYADMYGHDMETMDGVIDAAFQDKWSFDKLSEYLTKAQSNKAMKEELLQENIVIFVHLLGTDNNGHGSLPDSDLYRRNIRYFDYKIEALTKDLENFFGNDQSTAYFFTSDHGMANIGSHGDGSHDNTRCPLIAWGAGIATTRSQVIPKSHLYYQTPSDWATLEFEKSRMDIAQIDCAPTLSSLLRIPIPPHSIGFTHPEFFSNSDGSFEYQAQVMMATARQLSAQADDYHFHLMKSRSFLFTPSPDFLIYRNNLKRVQDLLQAKDFSNVVKTAQLIQKHAVLAMKYYESYDNQALTLIIGSGYLGIIVSCLLYSYLKFGPQSRWMLANPKRFSFEIPGFPIITLILFLHLYLFLQSFTFIQHVYLLVSEFFWVWNYSKASYLFVDVNDTSNTAKKSSLQLILLTVFGMFLVLQALSYSYYDRSILGILFIFWGLFPFFTSNASMISKLLFFSSSLLTGGFLFMPLDTPQHTLWVTSGSILLAGLSFFALKYFQVKDDKVCYSLIGLLIFSGFFTYLLDSQRNQQIELNSFFQAISWGLIISSLFLPLFTKNIALNRLIATYCSSGIAMTLLSVHFETLFFAFYCLNLFLWMWMIEKSPIFRHSSTFQITKPSTTQYAFRFFQISDFTLSILFLFLIHVAFFGTGNIASISSFQISSTYRFLTTFSPFLMGSLLLLKIFMPFIVLFVTYQLFINSRVIGPLPMMPLIISSIAFADVLGFNFFLFFTAQGSWLEIGSGLSRFSISNSFTIFLIALTGLTRVYIKQVKLGYISVFSSSSSP